MENDVCSSRSSCEALSNRSSPSKSEHFDSTILPSEQLLLLNHTAGIVIEDWYFLCLTALDQKHEKNATSRVTNLSSNGDITCFRLAYKDCEIYE